MKAILKDGTNVLNVCFAEDGTINVAGSVRVCIPKDDVQMVIPKDNDEFDQIFKPIMNPFLGEGCYHFETYGEEYGLVMAAHEANPNTVWTVVDGDDGNMYVTQGWHFVDRVHYIITKEASRWSVEDFLYHKSEVCDEQDNYCVTAVFDSEPDANHTKWFTIYDEAQAYSVTLGNDANVAIGKRLSLDAAQSLIAEGTEVCFIFDDGTESVYEGGDIDEMYADLPLATYSFIPQSGVAQS